MGQADRQHATLPLQSLQSLYKTLGRLAGGVHDRHHAAVGHRRLGPATVLHLGGAQIDQLECPFQHIGVGVLLEGDQQVSLRHHRLAQVMVRVQFSPDHHVGADDRAHPGQQVTLAVGVAIGHHGAVQA